MKRLVIFDLDGTLLNTIEDLGNAANYALERNGFATHSLASYPFFVGNGVRRLIERILPEEYRKTEVVDSLLKDFKVFYDDHCIERTKPYPGIEDLLLTLRDKDVRLAVASNKYQKAVDKIIPFYFPDIEFVAIEGHKEDVNVKPDPSVVFQVLLKAKLPKSEVLMVGDSAIDMETARRACVDSVAVTWGFRSQRELVNAYPTHIVHDPDQIIDLVDL